MSSRYSVGFLIPQNSSRVLGNDGWEFESDSRLPSIIESLLKENLSLVETSPDFSAYEGRGLKVSVLKDQKGEIENIYFRFYDGVASELPGFLQPYQSNENLDFFIPQ